MLKMKQVKTIVTASILTLALISCKKEEISTPQKGSVEFTFNLSTQVKSTKVDGVTPTAVILSAEDVSGNVIYKDEKVAVELIDGNYATKALEFEAGNYRLTKFIVTDANEIVQIAVPMGYSANASLVNSPLPIKFTVRNGYKTSVSPEMLSTQDKNPQDLGYASFNLNAEASYMLRIAAYVYNESSRQFETTSATLSINSAAGESINKDMVAAIDNIPLKEADKYIISITKDGYQSWADTLTANDILRFYAGSYAATLDKINESAFTFTTKQDSLAKTTISIKSADFSTPVRINWGDGQIEVVAANYRLSHTYKTLGIYKAKVTGNISSITKLTMAGCQLSAINVDAATGLSSIDVSRNKWLKSLNISSKPRLKEVLCVQGSLENLNISNSDSIEFIQCSVNNLSSLNVSSLHGLKSLYCDRNNIDNLDIQSNSNLQVLYCYKNNLTALDITKNIALETLDCRENHITNIDVTKSVGIKKLYLSNNSISNESGNKLLVDVLNNVKVSSLKEGVINITLSVKGDGQTAKKELEDTYKWTIGTN